MIGWIQLMVLAGLISVLPIGAVPARKTPIAESANETATTTLPADETATAWVPVPSPLPVIEISPVEADRLQAQVLGWLLGKSERPGEADEAPATETKIESDEAPLADPISTKAIASIVEPEEEEALADSNEEVPKETLSVVWLPEAEEAPEEEIGLDVDDGTSIGVSAAAFPSIREEGLDDEAVSDIAAATLLSVATFLATFSEQERLFSVDAAEETPPIDSAATEINPDDAIAMTETSEVEIAEGDAPDDAIAITEASEAEIAEESSDEDSPAPESAFEVPAEEGRLIAASDGSVVGEFVGIESGAAEATVESKRPAEEARVEASPKPEAIIEVAFEDEDIEDTEEAEEEARTEVETAAEPFIEEDVFAETEEAFEISDATFEPEAISAKNDATAASITVEPKDGFSEDKEPDFFDDNARLAAAEVAADELVTLNLDNVEIATALGLLARANNANIIAGPEVGGSVSINFRNVPFHQALSAILGISGYAYFTRGNVIYVTTEEKMGEMPPGINELVTRVFKIDHAIPEEVLGTITEFLSPGGSAVSSPGKKLVVRDLPRYMASIETLIAELDVAPLQVLITTKILTVSYNDDKSVGVDLIPTDIGVELTDIVSTGFSRGDLRDLPVDAIGLFAGTLIGDYEVLIDAIQEKADVEVIAAPEILVVDGELAHIQVGDRLGFRVTRVTETVATETIEFLEVGTLLDVTPHISKDGMVQLEIHPEISTGRISIDGLPSESTTELDTVMLVEDGSTVLIGGLLNLSKQRIRSQVPILGDIPIIGLLFGRNRWVDHKTEIIILITPQIVGPRPNGYMEGRIGVVRDRERNLLPNSHILEVEERFTEKAGRH